MDEDSGMGFKGGQLVGARRTTDGTLRRSRVAVAKSVREALELQSFCYGTFSMHFCRCGDWRRSLVGLV